MRRLAQPFLILALLLALAAIPAIAGPNSSLGVVTGADRANVAQVAAVDGTSVYDGDYITTQSTGAIRLRLGQSQLVLGGNTIITLHKSDAGVYATLLSGMVRFSIVPGSPIEVRALDSHSLIVRAKGEAAAIGQLSLVSPTVFEVGSTKGDLAVSVEGTDHVVAESTAYRVHMEEADGGPVNPTGRRGCFWIWFPVALVVTGTAVGLALAFFCSPSKP